MNNNIEFNQYIFELLFNNGFSKYSPGTILYSMVIDEAMQKLKLCSKDSEKLKLKSELLIHDSEFYINLANKLKFNLNVFHELIIFASEDIKLNQDNFVQQICKLYGFKKFDYRVLAYDFAEKILNDENYKGLNENNEGLNENNEGLNENNNHALKLVKPKK